MTDRVLRRIPEALVPRAMEVDKTRLGRVVPMRVAEVIPPDIAGIRSLMRSSFDGCGLLD